MAVKRLGDLLTEKEVKLSCVQYACIPQNFIVHWSILTTFSRSTIHVQYSYLWNGKHVLCFYWVIETWVEVWEHEKCCGNTSCRQVFPQLFRVLPNFHECFCNLIETWRTCFRFLLENAATRQGKQLVNFDYQNVNSLCPCHHYVNSLC